jgi:hypothetical protein
MEGFPSIPLYLLSCPEGSKTMINSIKSIIIEEQEVPGNLNQPNC